MFSRQAKVIRDAKGRLIKTTARGYQVLRDPALNKGTAFSAAERRALDLDGLLPPVVTTELEPQLERAYAAYRAAPTVADRTLALATPGTTRASLDAAPRLLPILWPAPLRASPQCCPPRSPAPVETPATKSRTTSEMELEASEGAALVRPPLWQRCSSDRVAWPASANVVWGARCGKSARRVLLGGTSTRRPCRLGEDTRPKGRAPVRLRKGHRIQGSSLPSFGWHNR